MSKTLILGYGNIDRQDDGAAWFVLQGIARHSGRDFPSQPPDEIALDQPDPHFLFTLQLTPELAEDIASYDRICFVDAHTGNIPEDVQVTEIAAQFQRSAFTHHLTPETLLSFCQTLYRRQPCALLVSVRGYEFNFVRGLSPQTEVFVAKAVDRLLNWINE